MNILILNHAASIGGASRSLTVIVQELLSAGCQVDILTPRGPMCDEWTKLGAQITIWKAPACSWFGGPVYSPGTNLLGVRCLVTLALLPLRLLVAMHLVVRLLRCKPIGAVHVNSLVLFPIGFPLWVISCGRNIRVIWHVRELLNQNLLPMFYAFIVRSITLSSHLIIAITSNEYVPFKNSGKVEILYNTVPASWFLQTSPRYDGEKRPFCVGMSCDLSPSKGISDFFQMVKMVGEEYTNVEFELYTNRPTLHSILGRLVGDNECYISECVLDDRIRLIFERELTPKEYARFSIYVRADRLGRPWGRDIIEAMCVGLPIVATGYSQEFVSDGETGLLVPPKNPKALADAIKKLLVDTNLRISMSEAAKKKASELFSPELHRRKLLSAFGLSTRLERADSEGLRQD